MKARLRPEARARRAELARACPDFAPRIAEFADLLDVAPGEVVAGYWPVRDEADPRALLAALDAPLALPRIEGRALSFRRWREGDALVDNRHGIAEPRADAERVTPHVLLVPLLAFDAAGHRLGYGGGYYDRALEALGTNVTAIGVAYAGQEGPALPREAHDRPLDAIITERGFRRFTTRRE
ncbi:MAG TPA: 5-formyltetrahydrofolate cyclo-ligase [Rhizomicrobium sp.]|nr:5-formyltetrahydrofolate cyclo-ligase [Rhizomicrobium sp.]